MNKIRVGVLGATGIVGQRYVTLLHDHPWFELVALAASESSAGKKYAEATKWFIEASMPESVAEFKVLRTSPSEMKGYGVELVFSALPSEVALKVEEDFAKEGFAVVTDASSHRMDPDVPIAIPEANPDHLEIVEVQRTKRRWKGFIVTSPNCTITGLALTLKPLLDKFGIRRVLVSTMQALSGAGYYGVTSMAILDNIIPYIKGEEEKVEKESYKILGKFDGEKIVNASFKLSASCHRVNVLDGHTEAVFVELESSGSVEDVKKAFREFSSEPQRLKLPTAPIPPIIVRDEQDRPQPRLDRYAGFPERAKGMAVVVGRVRKDSAFENGVKYVLLSHNTIRGAAGNSVLIAELLKARRLI